MLRMLTVVVAAFAVLSSVEVSLAQWVQVNTPYRGQVMSFATTSHYLFAGFWPHGILRSPDNGLSWNEADTGLANRAVIAIGSVPTFSDGSILFAGTDGDFGGITYRSTDEGTSWTPVDSGNNVWSFAVSGVNLFSANGGSLCVPYDSCCCAGVFLSTDLGITWAPAGLRDTTVGSLAAINTDIFAGTYLGVLLSTNNGTSWTKVNHGLMNIDVRVLGVSGANLFAGTSDGGVFLSTNRGTVWAPADSGLTGAAITSFAVSGSNLFAGTWGGGVFLSTNDGAHWIPINSGLTDTIAHSLVVYGNYLFAGTDSSVWRRPLSEVVTSVHNDKISIPAGFALEQNFPNPFNPTTTIGFRISEFGFVSLKVYNVLGQEVAKLVNEVKKPGAYMVQWDAREQASGVYFYRLLAGDFVATKKLLLQK